MQGSGGVQKVLLDDTKSTLFECSPFLPLSTPLCMTSVEGTLMSIFQRRTCVPVQAFLESVLQKTRVDGVVLSDF